LYTVRHWIFQIFHLVWHGVSPHYVGVIARLSARFLITGEYALIKRHRSFDELFLEFITDLI
jgi:hypothetical protein